LLRSDPIADLDLAHLYTQSTFDYASELQGLGNTYSKIVLQECRIENLKGGILEIGGGNGFFLEQMLKLGFENLVEIEPSLDAKQKSHPRISTNFMTVMFDNETPLEQEFGLAVSFHVLDHLRDPLGFLLAIKKNLRFEGEILLAVHNSKSISAKLLKNKSPIFDVEHTFLYDKKTLNLLLRQSGFRNVRVMSYWNTYSLAYLVQLLPISRKLRIWIANSKLSNLLNQIPLRVPLGNIYAVGTK
jgi:SAM-dependent methyltransferase